jgi:hypothetical protein
LLLLLLVFTQLLPQPVRPLAQQMPLEPIRLAPQQMPLEQLPLVHCTLLVQLPLVSLDVQLVLLQ